MTKEELIKRLIEMRKTGADETLDRVCESSTGCEDCPLYQTGRLCSHQTVDNLLDYIIENESEYQETNLEHYFDDSNEGWNQTKLVPVIWMNHECTEAFKKRMDAKADLINWLLAPYEPQKPLYQLRPFEYDFIKAHQEAYGDDSMLNWAVLKEWQKLGYLKNIPIDVGVADILKNAEVIEE